MLFRSNHPNLTKSNVKNDKDALTTGAKTQTGTQTPRRGGKDADADELADLLGGLSVHTKRCDICQISLIKSNCAAGAIRCDDCEEDLNASTKKSKGSKKAPRHRKHSRENCKLKKKSRKSESGQGDEDETEEEEEGTPVVKRSNRQRRVVMDSDDEDEGEWLIPEGERRPYDLGKAGGTDDENAEGGGDSLGSIDSDSFVTEVGGTPSKIKHEDSFIVHDTDSDDDAPVIRKKPDRKKVISLDSDSDAEDRKSVV